TVPTTPPMNSPATAPIGPAMIAPPMAPAAAPPAVPSAAAMVGAARRPAAGTSASRILRMTYSFACPSQACEGLTVAPKDRSGAFVALRAKSLLSLMKFAPERLISLGVVAPVLANFDEQEEMHRPLGDRG